MAVKCIAKSKLVAEPTEFLRDIENLSTVEHAHIVHLFGVASTNDSFMLVMSSMSLVVDTHLENPDMGKVFRGKNQRKYVLRDSG